MRKEKWIGGLSALLALLATSCGSGRDVADGPDPSPRRDDHLVNRVDPADNRDDREFAIYFSKPRATPMWYDYKMLPEEMVKDLGLDTVQSHGSPTMAGGSSDVVRRWMPLKPGVVRLYRYMNERGNSMSNEQIEANLTPESYYLIDENLMHKEISREEYEKLR